MGTVALIAGVLAAGARSAQLPVHFLQPISGTDPFPHGCGPETNGSPTFGAEVEPSAAVNPRNPKNIVAAWQQDRYETEQSLSNVVGYSRDGGRGIARSCLA
jgi:hypothetical protein